MKRLQGVTAVITGASGGMGREITRVLAQEGVKLALFSNDGPALEELAGSLPVGTPVFHRVLDVREEEQVAGAMAQAAERLGRPQILLNLAGLSIPAKLYEMTADDYELTMDVNVKGAFLFSKHFYHAVDPEVGGQIINIGSMAALRANGNAPLYCAAKASVNMLSAGMAIQYKERNIRVTTLNPGGADTPFWGDRPVKRENLLQASDIAEVVLFVLTRKNHVLFREVNFESFLNI